MRARPSERCVMSELFDGGKFKWSRDGKPWRSREMNSFVEDLVTGNRTPGQLQQRHKRSRKGSILTMIKNIQENLLDTVGKYEPDEQRTWRGGKKFTENEEKIIEKWHELNLPFDGNLTKLLQRPLKELNDYASKLPPPLNKLPNKKIRIPGVKKKT